MKGIIFEVALVHDSIRRLGGVIQAASDHL